MPLLEVIVFWVAAVLAVLSGIGVVVSPKPVYSAVSLIVTLANLAILYLLLNAQFIAAAQVLIYAGAVMVLFLFVITLLGVRDYSLGGEPQPLQRYGALVLGALLLAGIIYFVSKSGTGMTGIHGHYGRLVAQRGNVQAFGHELFNGFLLPFEVTPLLLLVAMVGAVALGKSSQESRRGRGAQPRRVPDVGPAPVGSAPDPVEPAVPAGTAGSAR